MTFIGNFRIYEYLPNDCHKIQDRVYVPVLIHIDTHKYTHTISVSFYVNIVLENENGILISFLNEFMNTFNPRD